MVFSSAIFLFLFLPVFFSVYYLAPERFRSLVILVGSYIFYGWWRVDFLLLFVAVTGWNYFFSKQIVKEGKDTRKKRLLVIGIAGNLLTLGYFKYAGFGVDSMNYLLEQVGMNPIILGTVILPIGISFYIFQAVSYLIDVYRGDAPISRSFTDFAAFIALFPQLIAGPVLRYKDLARQFSEREHSRRKFAQGTFRFMQGFIKKVLIADMIAPIADTVFISQTPSMADAWLGAITYTIQLYFDFSGYSDMAIGLGMMMGFSFIENFNLPYISRSITEFWRRWHISLSSWLKDYLYIPLGGSRQGKLKTYRNLLLTMLLGGLWHGANWTFVLWGGWHGIWLAIERFTGGNQPRRYHVLNWFCCMVLVILGWVMFRSESVGSSLVMYKAMFGGSSIGLSADISYNITSMQLTVFLVSLVFLVLEALPASISILGRMQWFRGWATVITIAQVPLFVLSLSRLIASSYSPFLYFQF